MRQQHHIVAGDQRRRHIGLMLEDIEPGARDPAAFQGGDQRRLIHHAAARDVDENAFRAQRFQHPGVDHVAGVGTGRSRHHQEIAFPRQVDQIGQEAIRRLQFGAVGIENLHAEALGAGGDGAADAAQAQNAQLLAADLAGDREFRRGPASGADKAVGGGKAARGHDHQPDGEVGDIVGQHVGRVGNGNAAGQGPVHRHQVVADAVDGDDLQPGHAVDQGCGRAVQAAGDQGAGPRGDLVGHGVPVGAGEAVMVAQPMLLLRPQELADGEDVDVLGSGNGHGGSLFACAIWRGPRRRQEKTIAAVPPRCRSG